MENVNWPLWIVAFSALIVAGGTVAVLVSVVAVLRKVSMLVESVRRVVGVAGGLIARAGAPQPSDAARQEANRDARLGVRALAVLASVFRLFRPKKG